MRDDDLIQWSGDLPALVPPGQYDAVVVSVKRVERFGIRTVEFGFRLVTLGPAFGVRLQGYCSLGEHSRVRPHSKVASWIRLIAAFTGLNPRRIPMRAFKEFWFRVEVRTVEHNYKKQPLAPRDQYSSVTDLVDIVGKVSELPADHQSKPSDLKDLDDQ